MVQFAFAHTNSTCLSYFNNKRKIEGGIRLANKNNYPNEFNNESPDILAARLAFIGSLLTTIGDGLTTVASNIALQQLLQNENNNSQGNQNSNNQISNNQVDQSKQIESLQRQVDYLTRKIDKRK